MDLLAEQVWSARPDGTLDFVNNAVVTYFGRPHQDILDSGWLSLLNQADVDACLAAWRHALATGEPYEIQFRLLGADGQYRWHLGRARAKRDAGGRIVGWIGTNTDIDDQKRADEARLGRLLREQAAHEAAERERDRLHRLFEQAPAAICILRGPDHQLVLLNQHYVQILGPLRDLIGHPIRKALPELEGQGFF